MRTALYLWRATAQRSWRTVLTVALIGGLFGAVALGALAGARRTASAYGRYLVSIKASDAYIGLNANPVVAGRIRDSFLTNSLTGSFDGAYFTRDRMTVLAGRLPRLHATREIALSPGIASLFGVGVGGLVTYQFYRLNQVDFQSTPGQRLTFRVTGIVDIPPVLWTSPTSRTARSFRPAPPGSCCPTTCSPGWGSGWTTGPPG
jgi:hypothetical protein